MLKRGHGWLALWGLRQKLIHIDKLFWEFSQRLSHSRGFSEASHLPRWPEFTMCTWKPYLSRLPFTQRSKPLFLSILVQLSKGSISAQIFSFLSWIFLLSAWISRYVFVVFCHKLRRIYITSILTEFDRPVCNVKMEFTVNK